MLGKPGVRGAGAADGEPERYLGPAREIDEGLERRRFPVILDAKDTTGPPRPRAIDAPVGAASLGARLGGDAGELLPETP